MRTSFELGGQRCEKIIPFRLDYVNILLKLILNLVLDFPSPAGSIAIQFVSDNEIGHSGYEIEIDQLPGSCRTSGAETARDARSLTGHPSYDPSTSSLTGQILPAGFHKRIGWDASISSGTTTLPFCGSTAKPDFTFDSPNFPLPYSPNTDCLYRVYRANERVCALELTLTEFAVGTGNSLDSLYCPNDFLEINARRYCGFRNGEHVRIVWPSYVSYVNMRFFTDQSDQLVGFRVNGRQLQGNECHKPIMSSLSPLSSAVLYGSLAPSAFSSYSSSMYVSPASAVRNSWSNGPAGSTGWSSSVSGSTRPTQLNAESLHYFNQNVNWNDLHGNSLPSNQNCPPVEHSGKRFRIHSPSLKNEFLGMPVRCLYRVWKLQPEVCALKFTFHDFRLTTSSGCLRDSLSFGPHRFCGQLPKDTISENKI